MWIVKKMQSLKYMESEAGLWKISLNLTACIKKTLVRCSPKFDNILNVYIKLLTMGCETERNFSK